MIIWLASYPKSGNTWVRSIISALLYTDDGNFSFNLINNIRQFPTKDNFRNFTDDLGNFHEIKKYWIAAQELINIDNSIKFLKTHHINCKIDNYNFTNNKNTLATIYIVRDPRNVVSSISNHFSKTLEESKNFLITPRFIHGHKKDIKSRDNSLKTLIGTWSEHYMFWKKNNKDFLLIKYEDLINNPEEQLTKIINFLGKYMEVKTNLQKNKNIIQTTSFENLKKLESIGTFHENAFRTSEKKINFFNLGPNNKWQKNLNSNIKIEIEQKFLNEMRELGYLEN